MTYNVLETQDFPYDLCPILHGKFDSEDAAEAALKEIKPVEGGKLYIAVQF